MEESRVSKVGQVWQWVADMRVILLIVDHPQPGWVVTLDLITAEVQETVDVFAGGPFWLRLA